MAHCGAVLVHRVVATQLDHLIMHHVFQADAAGLIADTSAKVKAAIGIVVVDVFARATAKSALHYDLFVLCGQCLFEGVWGREYMLWITVFCVYIVR